MWESILFFLVVALGLGFLVDLLIKNWQADFLEKIVIRMGAGILLIPFLGVVFNYLHIIIYWPIFLTIAILTFLLAVFIRKEQLRPSFPSLEEFSIKKSHIYTFLVLVLFGITAYMYISGSFAYPWFEDGDPYGYALTSKYIALEKTYTPPYYFMHFASPYPQGYSIFMGIMHQTNDSINWTLKFFNALIVSLSILFFFYFTKKLTKSTEKAFWSTVIITAIPAWVSHFIFALNFNVSLMFLLFYALFSIEENKNWKYLGAIFYATIILTHFYTAAIITVMLMSVLLLRLVVYKEFNKDHWDIFVLGLILGAILWIPDLIKNWSIIMDGTAEVGGFEMFAPMIDTIINSTISLILAIIMLLLVILAYIKHDLWFKHINKLLSKENIGYRIYLGVSTIILLVLLIPSEKLMYAKGSGTRTYSFSDFFFAQDGNLTNNPIGIGIVVMTLFMIGLFLLIKNFKRLFDENNFYLLVALTWTFFSFLGVMGASLSVGFVPFRMWTFFGMGLSLITGYVIYLILNAADKISKKVVIGVLTRVALITILIVTIYLTSFSHKYWHNTANWSEHLIMVPESADLFIWIKDGGLPKDSMVLPLCNYPSVVLGYDMLSKPWDDPTLATGISAPSLFYRNSLNMSLEENYDFLKKRGYDYTILGADCIAKFKANETLVINRINEMTNSTKFTLVKATSSEFLFRVK